MAVVAELLALVLRSAQTAAPRLSFEVASIQRNTSIETNGTLQLRPGGYFRAVSFNVFSLITFAFRTSARNLLRSQVAGAPDWTSSARCDIDPTIGRELFDATAADRRRGWRSHRTAR